MNANYKLKQEFIDNFSTLIKLRIDRYHGKHVNKKDFINKLIICPSYDCWDKDYIKYPMIAVNHLVENLGINLIEINCLDVSLNEDFQPCFYFDFFPCLIEEDFDDTVGFSLIGNEITFDERFMKLISSLSLEKLTKLIAEIKGEISFGTLQL